MKAPLALLFLLTISDTLFALPIQRPPAQDSRLSSPWKKYIPILGILGAVSLVAYIGHKADDVYSAVKFVEPKYKKSELSAELVGYLNRQVSRETPIPEDELGRHEELLQAFVPHAPDWTGMDGGMKRELEKKYKKVEAAMEKVTAAEKWREKQEQVLREEQAKVGVLLATEWREALSEAKASRTEGQ